MKLGCRPDISGLPTADLHGNGKYLACRFCGISGYDPVRLEGYAYCETCEESRGMQHCVYRQCD
jgi:hypothetical protein